MVRTGLFTRVVLTCLLSAILIAGSIYIASAAPEGGAVRAGSAQISQQGSSTLIRQASPRAVIDWRSFGINAGERVQFSQPSSSSAILNRVTGEKVSVILGRMDANGQVFLINPNGIVFGRGAQINVGSLIASTSNLSNDNFMQGRLVFDQPGKPGAGIANYGSITAAEGGLIALVAPHVRNDGVIQARLGKVVLGAADTFTIDFYGDGLINIALSEASLSQLRDENGQPLKSLVEQAGKIEVGAGKAVLVTADAARGMLDSLINMSGTIIADSAVQQGGSIVLLARGGNVDVSGTLSARGTTGGLIEVLGGQVHLTPTARLDADGLYGGGLIHVGGAWQGAEGTYRSLFTQIDPGSLLTASAIEGGNGGEVVAWSDRDTVFSGSILARGGSLSGNGGMVEVSGKGQLTFNGFVDASAANGKAGSLLLDPYDLTLGTREAGIMSRVLRTGTSVSVSADNDINLNYTVDGRGRIAGGGVTLSAGHDINLNDYLITSNGAINLFANAGTVRMAAGKVVHAGTAPIMVRSGSTLYSAPYLTGGKLTLASTLGSVNLDYPVESFIGDLVVQAAADVNVNQPVVSHMDGNSVTVTAGNSINVNALVDGRPAFGIDPVGTVTMTAGQNINLSKSIIAHDISLTATAGTITSPTMKDGSVTIQPNGIPLGEGLFSGTGPISVTTGGDLSSGIYVTTGPVSIRSTTGNINIDTKLAEVLGNVTIKADSGSVNIDQEIANIRSGHNLTITAGTNINLNRQIDALDDTNPLSITPVPGGSVTFTAGNNVNLNQDLATYNGPISIAVAGTLIQKADGTDSYGAPLTKQVRSGSAPISLNTGGDLSMGSLVTTGLLNVTSGGKISIDVPIYETTGNTTLTAAGDIDIKQLAVNTTSGSNLSMTSTGGSINVDARVGPWDRNDDGLAHNINPGGTITLKAHDNININTDIASYKGTLTGTDAAAISLTADAGTVNIADGKKVMSDSGKISVTAYGDLNNGPYINNLGESVFNALPTTGFFTTGPLSLTSVAGELTINQIIPDTTGEVTLRGGNAIYVNQRIYSNNANISLFAGSGGIIMAPDLDPGVNSTGVLSDIDSYSGNLRLEAEGNIYPSLLRSAGTLTVKSTAGFISGGKVARSRFLGGRYPSLIELAGSKGIENFNNELAPTIKAISDQGSIINLGVNYPSSLEIIAAGDIKMTKDANNWLGFTTGLYAGRDIAITGAITGSNVTAKAGRNISVGQYLFPVFSEDPQYLDPNPQQANFSFDVWSLNLSAGYNPFLSFADGYQIAGVPVKAMKDSWASYGPGNGNISASAITWVEGLGGFTANATGSISLVDVHVSYTLDPAGGSPIELANDIRQVQQPLNLSAGGGITVNKIENLGPITLYSSNGDITVNNTIGAHVTVKPPEIYVWNPYDRAPAGISITALNGNVNIQEARAEGDITVSAYGSSIGTGIIYFGSGIQSGGASLLREYQYVSGVPQLAYQYQPGIDYDLAISNVKVYRLPVPMPFTPVFSPGPSIAGPGTPSIPGAFPPGAPEALTALPAQPPGAVSVPETGIPAGSSQLDVNFDPERWVGTAAVGEVIPGEETDEDGQPRKILQFSGGRGLTREADLGQR